MIVLERSPKDIFVLAIVMGPFIVPAGTILNIKTPLLVKAEFVPAGSRTWEKCREDGLIAEDKKNHKG